MDGLAALLIAAPVRELNIVTDPSTLLATIASGAQTTPAVAAGEVHGSGTAASATPAPIASVPAGIATRSTTRAHDRMM
jgi:hypothetical protein